MSNSRSKVSISIEDRRGLLQVMDSKLQERTSGVGEIKTDLEPGIYKARASLSESISERYFEVKADADEVEISMPALQLKSAMPTLSNTQRQVAQQERLTQAIKHPTLHSGHGESALLLCSRFQASSDPGVLPVFRLKSADGKTVVFDFSQPEELRRDQDGIQVVCIMIEAGRYLLCHEPEFGSSSALAVEAVRGWRSEYFIRVDVPSREGAEGVPDLVDCFVSMARVDSDTPRPLSESRVSEVARRSLAVRQNLLSRQEMSVLLNGKFSDPIFGLLAANVELLCERPDLHLLRVVHGNVARMLGRNNADVVALRCALYAFEPTRQGMPKLNGLSKPLLAASWYRLKDTAEKLKKRYEYELAPPKGGSVWYVWEPNSLERLILDVVEATQKSTKEIKKQLRRNGVTGERIETVIAEQRAELGSAVLNAVTNMDWLKLGGLVVSETGESSSQLTKAQLSLLPALQLVTSEIKNGRTVSLDGLNTVREQLHISWKGLDRAVSDLGSLLQDKK